jgi:hydrogenase expression/formation protein HypE
MEKEKIAEATGEIVCPLPMIDYPKVMLGHGGGGRLTRQILQRLIIPAFRNEWLESQHDGAVFSVGGVRLAFTTDSYVVHPIVFPGGDIGSLAVNGTVNDLAMCGARPLHLSAALIIEEGLPMERLHRILRSMREAADAAGVTLVTGDTKVVDRGKGDQIFINTSGVGIVDPAMNIDPKRAAAGDRIIINGPIAVHGIAILSVREGLEFETEVRSDTAPLNGLVGAIKGVGRELHVLRDPTRGGLASVLNEIADAADVGVVLREEAIPVDEAVRGACEILGLDPLYVASEGRMVAFVPPDACDRVLESMRNHPLGRQAVVIGEVVADHPGQVVMRTRIGGSRSVDMLSGEQLPRIC